MDHHIDIFSEESISLLKEMVAVPSVSFQEDHVCSHLSNWLTSKDIAHERIGNNIIARSWKDEPCNSPVIMLCAHIDTVEASKGYDFDPFCPDYEKAAGILSLSEGLELKPEEFVAGLGSNDDGASAVAMIAAFRYLSGFSDRHNIVLVLTCEEERSGKDGMTGLWGSRLCSRGQGGEGFYEIDYAIVGEPTGMKAATSERGLLVIDGTAHGKSGHAARNEGVNALYIALEDIGRIRSHRFIRQSAAMGEICLNVTQINAGTAHNVIPDRCTFTIDVRPTEQYSNEEILHELEQICSSELKARNLANRSSATYQDSPLIKAAERLGIETFSSPTTSDWMRIGCDAVKMGPGESSRSHRKNEYVLTDEIRNGIIRYIEFIEEI